MSDAQTLETTTKNLTFMVAYHGPDLVLLHFRPKHGVQPRSWQLLTASSIQFWAQHSSARARRMMVLSAQRQVFNGPLFGFMS